MQCAACTLVVVAGASRYATVALSSDAKSSMKCTLQTPARERAADRRQCHARRRYDAGRLAGAAQGEKGGEGGHLMRSSTKSMVVPMTCMRAAGSIKMRTPPSSTTSSNRPCSSALAPPPHSASCCRRFRTQTWCAARLPAAPATCQYCCGMRSEQP